MIRRNNNLLCRFQDGYLSIGKDECIHYNEKDYIIRRYQGIHQNEFRVMELKDGKESGIVQLFDDGVLKYSWHVQNGFPCGKLTIYKDGLVEKETECDMIESGEYIRWRLNVSCDLQIMAITDQTDSVVIYRGEYNEKMDRSGYGIEYDRSNGIPLYAGYFEFDNIVHIHQRFSLETDGSLKMIEFSGNTKDNNTCSTERVPVYIGGCVFDNTRYQYTRHGVGKVINPITGICEYTSRWEKGEESEEERCVVTNGWFRGGKGVGEQSIRESSLNEQEKQMNIYLNTQKELASGYFHLPKITRIEIKAMEGHKDEMISFTIQNFPKLTSVIIHKECFPFVRTFLLEDLPALQSLTIEESSFVTTGEEVNDGSCKIVNCPRLQTICFGDQCFQDYSEFVLEQVPSLQSIQFGIECFQYGKVLMLKGEFQLPYNTIFLFILLFIN